VRRFCYTAGADLWKRCWHSQLSFASL